LGGGIANSQIWCQIFADILNEPIVRLRVNETETLGAAILAAKGVGLIDSLDEMTGYTTQHCEIIHPDKQTSAIYDDYFALYEKLYEDLKDNFITAQSIKEKHS
jgi:xylulokinase